MERPIEEIPIGLIREPATAARIEIDMDGLDELVVDIRERGLLELPGVVKLDDGTYEIVYGHRRLLALRRLGVERVRCMISEDRETAEGDKIAENIIRRDLNPAEEALAVQREYTRLGDDVDRVAALMGRSRAWVESRLLLLRLDPEILDALATGRVSLGVAQELGECADREDRIFLLEYAVRGGCTVAMMRQWVAGKNAQRAYINRGGVAPSAAEAQLQEQRQAPGSGADYAAIARPWEFTSGTNVIPCKLCGTEAPMHAHYQWIVCRGCANSFAEEVARGDRIQR